MMSIAEMNEIREELGLTYQKICMESGVPIGTVQKVLGGITRNPRMETMRQLEEALGRLKHDYDRQDYLGKGCHTKTWDCSSVHERSVYGHSSEGNLARQGSEESIEGNHNGRKSEHLFTATERDRLPNYMRTELIDGVIYEAEAPTPLHQDVAREIFLQIDACTKEHHASCRAYMAPTDVAIDRDEYTRVQPDVFVVCDKAQITRQNIQGPPAFILEVLSPSTRRRDEIEKLVKYTQAGVQEYWIADPDQRQVLVFDMRGNTPGGTDNCYKAGIYGFGDDIPLLISEGKCVIHMAPIQKLLDELYSEG